MNELVQHLVNQTGLPEDKAIAAIDTVIGFLKDKLPAPFAAQLDGAIAGESGPGGAIGGLVQDLGGMFGRK